MFSFSLQVLSETLVILSRSEREMIKICFGLPVKLPSFLSDLIIMEFSRLIFEIYSNIKFHENPSGGYRVVPFRTMNGRTERQAEMTKLTVAFAQFFEPS